MDEYDWKTLQQFVTDMKNTSSVIEKKEILKRSNDFIKSILHYTYNPYKKYNVTSKNCKKQAHLKTYGITTFFQLLDDLNNRVITGHEAIHAVNAYIERNSEYSDLIYSVIDRNLQIRASESIINGIFPELIPTFDVALAQAYEEKFCNFAAQCWYASRKLDGVRCIVRKEGNTTIAYSRQGNEFTTLGKIIDNVSQFEGDFVLDGEICLIDEFGNDDFQGIMKEIKRKDHTIQNPKYIVFDKLLIKEFDTKTSTRILSERLQDMDDITGDHISCLKQTRVESKQHLDAINQHANDNGYEGVMLRHDPPYEGRRTKKLLKCKTFFDAEYIVKRLDFENHRIIQDGKEVSVPMLAQVWVEHKGFEVAVGSGWSQEQRMHYQKFPDQLIGKTITVKYFEETKNQNGGTSLRFPTLKFVHGETREC